MKRIHALLAVFMVGASLGAAAHEGEDHGQKAGPARIEQKAWGIAGDAQAVRRTIEIRMSDTMRFSPDRIDVKQGETVRFVVRNTGQVLHELVIGTRKELDEHAALMMKFPAMEHDEPYMTHVKPGEVIWTFNRPGTFDFACLIAGHYQAGMAGKITVAGSSAADTAPAKSSGHGTHKH